MALSLMTVLLVSVADGGIPLSNKAYARPSNVTTSASSAGSCQNLPISSVIASGNSNLASNVLDNNLNTAWVNNGIHSWIQADLGSNMNICTVNIAWYLGNMLKYKFVISVSSDGSTFTNVFASKSSGVTLSPETYALPGGTTGRFVRITVNGNNLNKVAGITELSVDGFSNIVQPQPTANNEIIQINSGAPVQITFTGTDPIPGDMLQFSVVTSPQHGTLTFGTVSSVVFYTPNTGFTGTDSFTYKATDGQGVDSNIATVTLIVGSNIYDNFDGGKYTLSDGQTSPNGKWLDNYNGFGSVGVQDDGTGTNNVFFESPAISTSPSTTHAALVTSTQKWGNFQLDIDVKTVQQLRQNSSPNPWEVAWVFFRQTDTFHYYAFLVKPNGIEFDKKDCNTCTDPVQGQQFLVTASSPILKIGGWSHWTITAIGNHIMISVDGNKVVDYVDQTMSQQLSSGAIAMYTEDANVNFDNVSITPQ